MFTILWPIICLITSFTVIAVLDDISWVRNPNNADFYNSPDVFLPLDKYGAAIENTHRIKQPSQNTAMGGKTSIRYQRKTFSPPFESSDVRPDISNDTIACEEQMYFWSFFSSICIFSYLFAHLPFESFTRRIKQENKSKAPPDKDWEHTRQSTERF